MIDIIKASPEEIEGEVKRALEQTYAVSCDHDMLLCEDSPCKCLDCIIEQTSIHMAIIRNTLVKEGVLEAAKTMCNYCVGHRPDGSAAFYKCKEMLARIIDPHRSRYLTTDGFEFVLERVIGSTKARSIFGRSRLKRLTINSECKTAKPVVSPFAECTIPLKKPLLITQQMKALEASLLGNPGVDKYIKKCISDLMISILNSVLCTHDTFLTSCKSCEDDILEDTYKHILLKLSYIATKEVKPEKGSYLGLARQLVPCIETCGVPCLARTFHSFQNLNSLVSLIFQAMLFSKEAETINSLKHVSESLDKEACPNWLFWARGLTLNCAESLVSGERLARTKGTSDYKWNQYTPPKVSLKAVMLYGKTKRGCLADKTSE